MGKFDQLRALVVVTESSPLLRVNARITICPPSGGVKYRVVGSSGDIARGPDMSDQWPEFGSQQPNAESGGDGSSSTDGASVEDALSAPDGPAEERSATQDQPGGESPGAVEPAAGDVVSGAAGDATAAPNQPADADDAAAAAPEDGSVFLAELVRALQTTAGLERVRIGEDTERRRQAHIDRVRAREASEAERMRELAGEDMKAIEAWADGETKRIQLERERRATTLQEDLEASLAEHRSKIDREIDAVEAAIATYRAEVDAFFEGFGRETDLILIAHRAARRPVFPTLEAAAETVGATEPAAVGVMDPHAAAEPIESWAAPRETNPEPAPAGAPDGVDQESVAAEPAEPVAAATGQTEGSSSHLLQSVTVKRPMSWLRRDANDGDTSNREG